MLSVNPLTPQTFATSHFDSPLDSASPSVPASPENVVLSASSPTSGLLTWAASPGASHYKINCYDLQADQWTTLAQAHAGTSLPVAGLQADRGYKFSVHAVNAAGESEGTHSNYLERGGSVAPEAVAQVSATKTGEHQAEVAWTPSAGATGYRVARYDTLTRQWQTLATNLAASTLTVNDLEVGREYKFSVQALNASGIAESVHSDFLSFTALVKPASPVSVTIESFSETAGRLTWEASPTATGYKINRYDVQTDQWTSVTEYISGTTLDFSGLQADRGYKFSVHAINDAGESEGTHSAYFARSGQACPAQVGGVTATSAAYGEAQIAWTAVAGATGYRVNCQDLVTGAWSTLAYNVSETSLTRTDLVPGRAYKFSVHALNASGIAEGTHSNEVTVAAQNANENENEEEAPRPPVPGEPLEVILRAGTPDYQIDLASIFSNENAEPLHFELVGQDNFSLAEARIEDGVLILDFDTARTGVVNFVIRATDSAGRSVENSVAVSVVASPVLGASDAYRVSYRGTLTVAAAAGLLANDALLSGAVLEGLPEAAEAVLVAGPVQGTLQLAGDGSFVYTALADQAGQDRFTYRVACDGEYSEPIEVLIDLIDTLPGAPDRIFSCFNNSAISVASGEGLLAGLVDAEGAPLRAELIAFSDSDKGRLTVNADGSFAFVPADGFSGVVEFTYAVSDGHALSTPATVKLNIKNNNSIAVHDIYSVGYGRTLSVDAQAGLLKNDLEQAGRGALLEASVLPQITLVSGPAHGTVQLGVQGDFRYQGEAGFSGVDSFVYRLTDQHGHSSEATATINVVLETPRAQTDKIIMGVEQTVTLNSLADLVLANDFTNGTAAATQYDVVLTGNETQGNVVLNDDGTFEYVAAAGFAGVDRIGYQVLDHEGNLVTESSLVVQVRPDIAFVPLADGYHVDPNSAQFGAISLGGQGAQIGPDAVFIPDVIGTYTSEETAERTGDMPIPVNGGGNENETDPGDEAVGDGTEVVSIFVFAEDLGNGNWSYTEFSTYTYDIDVDDDCYYGGYTYILTASFIDGVYGYTYFLTTEDRFQVTEVIEDVTDSSTTHLDTLSTGGVTNTIILSFTHNTSTAAITATDFRFFDDLLTYTGTGYYTYAMPGGAVSGTILQTGLDDQTTTSDIIQQGNESDGWTSAAGTQFAGLTETWTNGYIGLGDYSVVTQSDGAYSEMSGIITEDGSDLSSVMLNATGILDAAGQWTFTGSGTSIFGKGDSYTLDGSGAYARYDMTPGNTWSMTGEQCEHYHNSDRTDETVIWMLADEEWVELGGTGGAFGCQGESYGYEGSGWYSRYGGSPENGWSDEGTMTENGGNDDSSCYDVRSNFLAGAWISTGTGGGHGGEHAYSDYEGGGEYASKTSSGGTEFCMSGTSSGCGFECSGMNYETSMTLLDDGTWASTGTGCDHGGSYACSSYCGCGEFRQRVDAPNVKPDAYYCGEACHNGCSDSSSNWNADWSMENGVWSRIDGDGSATSRGRSHIGYEGGAINSAIAKGQL